MENEAIKLIGKFEVLENQVKFNERAIGEAKSQLELMIKAKQFLIGFSEFSRERVKAKLENIVNTALSAVFKDKKLVFKIIPNKTKLGVIYNLYVETDGHLYPLMNAKGGGVKDVVALALRVAFLRLFSSRLRQVMILDEPFKNIDKERISNAVQWLKVVSHEFELQFIMVTHIPTMVDYSDKHFEVKLIGGVSQVK